MAPQNTASSPAPRNMVDLQVVGENRIADEIGDHRETAGCDHRGNDRQPIETVRQIDRVGSADDDQDAERQIEPPEVEQHSLEKRHGERVRERCRRDVGEAHAGDCAEGDFERQLGPSGKTAMRVAGQLTIIVDKPDQTETDRDEQNDPDIRIGEIGPEQGRNRQRQQDQKAAHRRRSLLAHQVPGRAVGANRLTVRLFRSQPGDDPRPANKADQQRGDDGTARAKRYVAKKIEALELVGEGIKQGIEHRLMPRAASPPPAAHRRSGRCRRCGSL